MSSRSFVGLLLVCALWACDEDSDAAPQPAVPDDGGLLHEPIHAKDLEPADLGSDAGATDAQLMTEPCGELDCAALTAGCAVGYCDADTGTCETRDALDATPCDDGDPCTVSDTCLAGACAGVAFDCSALDDQCNVGACDRATGTCAPSPREDGTICDDGSVCTTGDACNAGGCAGATLDCSGSISVCHAADCDPKTGCVAVALTGGNCDDLDPCTDDDTCNAGTCAGAPVDCSPFAGPCSTAACVVGIGGCQVTLKGDGVACEDGSACTTGDTCANGSCIGAPTVCPTPGPCQVPTCDPLTGDCGLVPALDGATCDDDDGCTVGDHCESGTCAGIPRVCPAASCRVGVCQSPAGTCTQTPAPDDTTCDSDALDCVASTCQGGACQDAARADCSTCGAQLGLVCDPYQRCGQPIRRSTYGFDDGMLAAPFTTSGPAAWSTTLTTFLAGAGAVRSAAVADGETSVLALELRGSYDTALSFWVYVSSEDASAGKAGDALVVYLDGVEARRWQATATWLYYRSWISPGLHTVSFVYEKDDSISAGGDGAFVDEIVVENVSEPLSLDGSLAPLQTSGDVPFVLSGLGAPMAGALAAGQESVLTLPVSFTREVGVGFWLDATVTAPDSLVVSLDGTPHYSFNYGATGLDHWTVTVPAGASNVEWRVTRAAGSGSIPSVTISDIDVTPKPCP